MPIAYPGNSATKPARARAGGGFESAIESVPSFVPMIAENFSGATVGATNGAWTRADYSNVTAKSGTVSTRLRTDPGQPPSVCGGSTGFGRRRSLPALVPVGKTVWQRIYMYLPSEFSMGYVYNSGDDAEASTCGGKPTDGGQTNLKWMVFAPDTTTARTYFQPYIQRRQALQSSSTPGLRVLSEVGPKDSAVSGPALPRDQWFALQMAVKVSKDTNDGFVRAWINSDLVAEVVGGNTVGATDNGLAEWGIGDYWNGIPWTDGAAGRDTFYIDEIIVASDADGYGAPTGVDANGNAYIAPTTLVSSL